MLMMLTDADDANELAQNMNISRENSINYSILVTSTENKTISTHIIYINLQFNMSKIYL